MGVADVPVCQSPAGFWSTGRSTFRGGCAEPGRLRSPLTSLCRSDPFFDSQSPAGFWSTGRSTFRSGCMEPGRLRSPLTSLFRSDPFFDSQSPAGFWSTRTLTTLLAGSSRAGARFPGMTKKDACGSQNIGVADVPVVCTIGVADVPVVSIIGVTDVLVCQSPQGFTEMKRQTPSGLRRWGHLRLRFALALQK